MFLPDKIHEKQVSNTLGSHRTFNSDNDDLLSEVESLCPNREARGPSGPPSVKHNLFSSIDMQQSSIEEIHDSCKALAK
jgi:hypothetical protein